MVLFSASSDNKRISFHLSECRKLMLCTGKDPTCDRSRDYKGQQVREPSVSRNLFLQGRRDCATMPFSGEVPTSSQELKTGPDCVPGSRNIEVTK